MEKMSDVYARALEQSIVAMQKIGPKLVAKKRLSTEEGATLLNTYWNVELCALCDGDIPEARDTEELIVELRTYLRNSCAYTVEFIDNKYVVTDQKGIQA